MATKKATTGHQLITACPGCNQQHVFVGLVALWVATAGGPQYVTLHMCACGTCLAVTVDGSTGSTVYTPNTTQL